MDIESLLVSFEYYVFLSPTNLKKKLYTNLILNYNYWKKISAHKIISCEISKPRGYDITLFVN